MKYMSLLLWCSFLLNGVSSLTTGQVSGNAKYEEDEIILLYMLHRPATALYLLVSRLLSPLWRDGSFEEVGLSS